MARYRHEGYTLLARQTARGRVWYYRWYDADGQRRGPRSTGIGFTSERDRARTRRQATAYCDELARAGRLGGDGSSGLTLDAWVHDAAFWSWSSSRYVRGILERSPIDRPGITESYVIDAGRVYDARIRPYHGHLVLERIRPADCERLLLDTWRATGRSARTLNNWRSIYSTMMGEAERLGVIDANPWRRVAQLAVQDNRRGPLSLADGAALLDPSGLNIERRSTLVYYVAVKLALLCGLRIGEVCGLQTDDVVIRPSAAGPAIHYLDVRRQYNAKVGRLVPTKDKDARAIPLVASVVDDLLPFLAIGRGRFLLSHDRKQRTPLPANRLRDWFNRRADKLGIDRAASGVTFHSCRRFFNTLLRRRVSDDVLRRMTGHDGAAMTEHYTDYLPQDLLAIADAQAAALSYDQIDRQTDRG